MDNCYKKTEPETDKTFAAKTPSSPERGNETQRSINNCCLHKTLKHDLSVPESLRDCYPSKHAKARQAFHINTVKSRCYKNLVRDKLSSIKCCQKTTVSGLVCAKFLSVTVH